VAFSKDDPADRGHWDSSLGDGLKKINRIAEYRIHNWPFT
jgi:hypothetical protein